MAVVISVIESEQQFLYDVPAYVVISINEPANVYYTLDGSFPDETGFSLGTFLLETLPNDPLSGRVYLPKNNTVYLNILAIGTPSSNRDQFYRRYGVDATGVHFGDYNPSYISQVATNSINGQFIDVDGYTEGYGTLVQVTLDGYDGYEAGYVVATSGEFVGIPGLPTYKYIDGYDENGNPITVSNLSETDRFNRTVLQSRDKKTFLMTSNGLVSVDPPEIDPRSSSVKDLNNDDGFTVPIDRYIPQDSFYDRAAEGFQAFTGRGGFNPNSYYIEIDGRVDGYISGQEIQPGDISVVNSPHGLYARNVQRANFRPGYIGPLTHQSHGLIRPIYDYEKGQAAFYYHNKEYGKFIVSLQKIGQMEYKLNEVRNGHVVAHVFKWVRRR